MPPAAANNDVCFHQGLGRTGPVQICVRGQMARFGNGERAMIVSCNDRQLPLRSCAGYQLYPVVRTVMVRRTVTSSNWLGGALGPASRRMIVPLVPVKRKVTVPVGSSATAGVLLVCWRARGIVLLGVKGQEPMLPGEPCALLHLRTNIDSEPGSQRASHRHDHACIVDPPRPRSVVGTLSAPHAAKSVTPVLRLLAKSLSWLPQPIYR